MKVHWKCKLGFHQWNYFVIDDIDKFGIARECFRCGKMKEVVIHD